MFALSREAHPSSGAHTRPAMPLAVRRLALTDFRSYEDARLQLDARPMVLTGPNGAGKTNLLEALSLLAPGRGLRRASLTEMDRQDGGPFAVAAQVDGVQGRCALGVGHEPDGERERRTVRIDHAPGSSQMLAERLSLLWLTPAQDRLFLDGPGERRRFLDRLVLVGEPAHAAQNARYQHALRERLRLLRGGVRDPAWLSALEARAAASAVAIAAARRALVRGLSSALVTSSHALPRPSLAIDGEVERWLDTMSALDAEERMAERLARARAEDAEAGTTSAGPHRSDLVVRNAATGGLARGCSTGEQKALLVGILMAEARRRAAAGGWLPVLLLDEVAAHLDAARRQALFDELSELGAQAWLTGTDAALFAPLRGRAQFVTVRASTLHADD